MSKAKRHRLLVEITDMSGTMSTKRIGHMVSMAVVLMVYHAAGSPYFPSCDTDPLANVQVKDLRRVTAAHRVAWQKREARGVRRKP